MLAGLRKLIHFEVLLQWLDIICWPFNCGFEHKCANCFGCEINSFFNEGIFPFYVSVESTKFDEKQDSLTTGKPPTQALCTVDKPVLVTHIF